jgi:phosphoglucosamine mutase
MKIKDCPLSKLTKCWNRFPQLMTNIRVREKIPFEQLDGLMQLISQAEAEVQGVGGRVLLRYSGTEPKARLLMEGPNSQDLARWSHKIGEAIKKHVGA